MTTQQSYTETMAHRQRLLPDRHFSNNNVSTTTRKTSNSIRHTDDLSNNVTVCHKRGKSRILTIGLYHKRHQDIQRFLKSQLLHHSEVKGALDLLRLAIYYPEVYAKARQICENPGCSIRTFWRMVSKLKDSGLVRVKNRYHDGRQISNRYDLDKLILAIVRYLWERLKGGWLLEASLKKISRTLRSFLFVRNFWSLIRGSKVCIDKGQIFLKGATP